MTSWRFITSVALILSATGCTASLGLDERGIACDEDGQCDAGKMCLNAICDFPPGECGNGIVETGETCDGDCRTSCNDAIACTTDILSGDPASCNVACEYTEIAACANDDGCCPPGCSFETDSDCSATCGNGVIDSGELCDGDCPTSCDDGVSCTQDNLVGSAANCTAQCVPVTITDCVEGDGCCAAGCSPEVDSDCSTTCGDGIVDAPSETCDGNCPTNCDDTIACTVDIFSGSAENCTAGCSYVDIVLCESGDGCCPAGCVNAEDSDCEPIGTLCGNGIVDAGELCDGNCPDSCQTTDACIPLVLQGSEDACNAECVAEPISECVSGDSCCPSSCNSESDFDCASLCGNGVLDLDETCDGDCPTSCAPLDTCMVVELQGNAFDCTAQCVQTGTVTACANDDGCCADGCSAANDNDCASECGNGVIEPGEVCDGGCPASCDDGLACTQDLMDGEDCSVTCSYSAIELCVDDDGCCPGNCTDLTDSDCSSSCGDGVTDVGEVCDGDCPFACDDSVACTTDLLVGSANTCSASCSFQAIDSCVNDDGC
ncbi:MAG: hypothetical protein HOK97_07400, partial [Deltaproteobacteria bacterium]|nr:hypothetical protein [Deltaproteobacteria bacterium]